jgi:hypothetical protein
MPTRAWAQRLRGSGLGATTTTTPSTPQAIQEAQQALASILSDGATQMAQTGANWPSIQSGASATASNELQSLVNEGGLNSSDSANLLTQFNLALAQQWQSIQASNIQSASATPAPSSVSLFPTSTASPDTITLPIVGTISYTEAAIGAVAIVGGLWLMFGQKSGRR